MWVLFLMFFRKTQAVVCVVPHFKVGFSRFGSNYVIKPIFYTVAMIILTLNNEQDYLVMHDNLQLASGGLPKRLETDQIKRFTQMENLQKVVKAELKRKGCSGNKTTYSTNTFYLN